MTNDQGSAPRPVSEGDVRRRVLTDCLQASARLYMFFARETLSQAGEAGDAPVRESVRRYGEWRGTEMRQAHTALGMPINVETLMRYWDSASTYVAKDEVADQGSYSAHDVSFDVTYCPAALAWKEGEFHRWGHVYCDEFHQSAATAYHPDAMVTIPINMMKGDHRCAFRWVMPNLGEEDLRPRSEEEQTGLGRDLAPLYAQTGDEADAMRLALTRTNRLLGGRYLTFVQALVEHLGEDSATRIVSDALAAWAEDRGARLHRRLERTGASLAASTVWNELDLAPAFTWQAELDEGDGEALLAATVRATPLDEVWAHYGGERWAELFWRTTMPALFRRLFPGGRVEVDTDPDGRLLGLAVLR